MHSRATGSIMSTMCVLSCILVALGSLTVHALQVTLNPQNTVGPIASYYASLSIEYFGIRDLFLSAPYQPAPSPLILATELPKRLNMAVIQLIANLGQATGSNIPAVIRIGGNSATATYLKTSQYPRLAFQEHTIDEYEFQILGILANITNFKFVINIGMPTIQPTYLPEFLTAVKKWIPTEAIIAIEVGNEPDHYQKRGIRDATYTAPAYFIEYDAYAAVVNQMMPGVQLMGPSYAYGWRDLGYQIPFIQSKAASTKYMSFHRYALRGCAKASSLEDILDDPNPSLYQWISDISEATAATNTINVWGEGGTASCKGLSGISDVFASALWTVDSLFEFGIRGVGLALLSGAPQALYAPFTVINGTMDVRGTYYGMMFFNAALGGQNTHIYRPTMTGDSLRLKAWATYDSSTNTHVIVVLHKSTNPAETVTVQLPSGAPSQAQKIIMTAPALDATTDETIAGLHFDNTADGLPHVGSYTEELVNIDSAGRMTFVAPTGSATLVRIRYNSNDMSPIVSFTFSNSIQKLSDTTGIKPGAVYVPGTGYVDNEAVKPNMSKLTLLVCLVVVMYLF